MADPRQQKVILLGSVGVGKTTLLTRISENRFDPDTQPTASAAFCPWTPDNGDGMAIQFWDTSGMEKYRSVNRIYYRDSVAALLVFDLTDKRTFEEIDIWTQEYRSQNTLANAILILVGNKCDLGDKCIVKEEDARTWADENAAQYFPVSAMTGEGVVELLDGFVRTMPRRMVKTVNSLALVLDDPVQEKSAGRCC
jgi:small GTP-binding protein